MSKALKKIAARHRPTIAARMTAANGYDETKHLHPVDLQRAGLINGAEASDLDNCVDDLATGGDPLAAFINAAKSGMVDNKGLNDDAVLDALTPHGDDDVFGGDDDDTTAATRKARA